MDGGQRADQFCRIGPPKSESSRRTVPLDASMLLPALKAWKLACPIGEADLVFPDSQGDFAHHEKVLRSLEPIMRAAGVTAPVLDDQGAPVRDAEGNAVVQAKYAMHAFRHFFAGWCINPKDRGGRGLQAKEVQDLLGHSSIVMTLDIYGHLFPRSDDHSELAKAVSTLLA